MFSKQTIVVYKLLSMNKQNNTSRMSLKTQRKLTSKLSWKQYSLCYLKRERCIFVLKLLLGSNQMVVTLLMFQYNNKKWEYMGTAII